MTRPVHPAFPTVLDDLAPEDFYFEGPYVVFTAAYHLRRGFCCNSDCRHCPYSGDAGAMPTDAAGSTAAAKPE